MTRDEVVRLFDEWQVASASRDPAVFAKAYASDCVISSPVFGDIKGRAAVEEAHRKLYRAFPDWDLRTEQLIVDGDHVAQVVKVTCTHAGEFMGLPGTGRKAQIHGVRVITLDNGLIKHEQRLYDFTLLLMQVGVLRGKPGH